MLGPFFGPIYYIEEDFSFTLRKIEMLIFFHTEEKHQTTMFFQQSVGSEQ